MNSPIAISSLSNWLQKPTGEASLGDAYLCFQLDEQTQALLPLAQVHEVITVSTDQITPMPNMPACVLGLLGRRSRVMWVVDLAHLLVAKSSATRLTHYEIVVLQVEPILQKTIFLATSHKQLLLGVVVQKIRGSRYFSSELIQAPQPDFAPGLASYLKGYVLQEDNLMLILDAETIARSPTLQLN